MSQSSFLEDIQSWDLQKCSEQVSVVLPKLVAMYANGCSLERKVSLLAVMVKSFVPVISVDHLEPQFMALVFPETEKVYNSIMTTLLSTLEDEASCVADLEQTLVTHIKMLIDLLAPLESTLLHIIQHSGGSIQLSTIQSAPVAVGSIIRKSFDHCKESNIIYGNHFEALSGQLSSFFKKTYTLQKALMALLDLVQLSQQEQMSQLTAEVSSEFHDICTVISSMDTSLMANTWKFLVKFVTKHKESLEVTDLQIAAIAGTLCAEIRSHFRHCLTQAPLEPRDTDTPPSQGREAKSFSKTVKVCGLLAKMLIHLLKEFDKIHEDCSEVVLGLVQYLHSHSPPCLSAPRMREDALDELKRSFLVCIEPLLAPFISCRRFYETLLSPMQDLEGDIHPFGHLLTLVTVMRLLPQSTVEMQDRYHGLVVFPEDRPRDPIIKCVLQTISRCYPEFVLPVYLPGIVQPQRRISLHEYIVTNLNSCVATVTANQFKRVEECLLEMVVRDRFPESLVAVDVWCFVARYGTAELCAYHCQLLAGLVKSFSSTNQSPAYLRFCLQRLVPLMADASKHEFMQLLPVDGNVSLWCQLPLQTFSSEHRKAVYGAISKNCLQSFGAWTESNDSKDLYNLFQSLTDLSRFFHQIDPTPSPTPLEPPTQLAAHLVAMLQRVSTDSEKFEPFTSAMYVLSSCLLLTLRPESLQKVLEATLSTASSSSSLLLKFSILSLLQKLGKLDLSILPQEQSILKLIPKEFSFLLSDDNPALNHLAMVAFSEFAQETVHEALVPKCIQDETTQNRVVTFLNQIPVGIPETKSEVDYLKEQAEVLQQFHDQCTEAADHSGMGIGTSTVGAQPHQPDKEEPQSKKLKLGGERSIQESLTAISAGVEEVKRHLTDLGYKPPWFNAEIDRLMDALITLKEN